MQTLPTLQDPPENHHGVGHSNTHVEKGALTEGRDGSECDGVSTGVPHAHLLHDDLLSLPPSPPAKPRPGLPAHGFPAPSPSRQPFSMLPLPLQMPTGNLKGTRLPASLLCNLLHVTTSLGLLGNKEGSIGYSRD